MNVSIALIFDVNGDGKAEVICRQGDEICILEGATGNALLLCRVHPLAWQGALASMVHAFSLPTSGVYLPQETSCFRLAKRIRRS